MIVKRGVREQCGVAITLGSFFSSGVHTPSITNDQNDWFLCHSALVLAEESGFVHSKSYLCLGKQKLSLSWIECL
jgi:hypothetical protein